MDEVVTTNSGTIAVATNQNDVHFRASHFYTGSKCSCTAVSGVQGAAVDVARQTGSTTDAGNQSCILFFQFQSVHCTDKTLHDNTVTAARAPDMGQFAGTDILFVIKSHVT